MKKIFLLSIFAFSSSIFGDTFMPAKVAHKRAVSFIDQSQKLIKSEFYERVSDKIGDSSSYGRQQIEISVNMEERPYVKNLVEKLKKLGYKVETDADIQHTNYINVKW